MRREEEGDPDKDLLLTSAEPTDVWSLDLMSTFARARARARANVAPLAAVEAGRLRPAEKSEEQYVCLGNQDGRTRPS